MGRKFTIFALFNFVFESKFQVQAPGGAYIGRGDLTESFLRYEFGGAYIWRGVYMEGLIFGILRYTATSSRTLMRKIVSNEVTMNPPVEGLQLMLTVSPCVKPTLRYRSHSIVTCNLKHKVLQ